MERLFARAAELKAEFAEDRRHATPPLQGRSLAMLFQRPSLRTRVTFEAGMTQLGGHAIYLTEGIVLGGRESVADVAHNLERFVDAIMARTGPHEVVAELAAQASIPVVNGLTIREHPCQVLADLFTLRERFGDLRGLPLAFVGDGNNVYHSLALMGATLGMEIRIAHPAGYAPNERIVARASELAEASGGRLVFDADPRAVVPGAAVDLHRRLDVDGAGGRGRGAPRRLLEVPGQRRLVGDGARRARHALSTRTSRRGDHLGRDGRSAKPHLRPVGEPAARAEGAAGRAHRGRAARREVRRDVSGEALYERYKDALRRGHVASLRGRLEEALTAYAEAAAIAPERATPHTSAGTALMRRKRPADAVRHYTTAVRLAPRDEAALLGRAQALAALDRRPQAGDAYDAVAEVQAANGKLADAVDSARRGLELAEGRERRRTLERLIERLRASEPAEPGRVALEKAMVVLEGRAIEPRSRPRPRRRPRRPRRSPGRRRRRDESSTEIDADVVAAVAAKASAARARGAKAPAEPAVDGAAPEAIEPTTAARRPRNPHRTPAAVSPAAGSRPAGRPGHRGARAVGGRDPRAAVPGVGLDELLDLASAYRRDGRADAALDTCYLALSVAPDDVGLHLALVELYDERGWTSLAGEKLDLLDRLTALDPDPSRGPRVAGARGARALREDPPARS